MLLFFEWEVLFIYIYMSEYILFIGTKNTNFDNRWNLFPFFLINLAIKYVKKQTINYDIDIAFEYTTFSGKHNFLYNKYWWIIIYLTIFWHKETLSYDDMEYFILSESYFLKVFRIPWWSLHYSKFRIDRISYKKLIKYILTKKYLRLCPTLIRFLGHSLFNLFHLTLITFLFYFFVIDVLSLNLILMFFSWIW